jgi:DinB superfamily
MIDFSRTRSKELSHRQLCGHYTAAELRQLTNEMIDLQLSYIADCTDADVVFVPSDPDAKDTYASNEADVDIAWTLGHLIVHVTASSEESAAIAAELARGVPHRGGRSRAEVAWETVTTVAQCQARLEESRRMRLASLDMWPDAPDMENSYAWREGLEPFNAPTRFCLGFAHDDDHLAQIREVVRQAKAARS